MSTVEVVPGLVIDDAMFDRAAEGVAAFAPETGPLTRERFASSASWLAVPDDRGALSKVEMTLLRTVERTVRLNVWFRADLRGGDRPMPHNHPWVTFTARVLLGGYSENRYWCEGGDVTADLGVQHVSPGANTIDYDTYHEVSEVHAPGRTMSLMVCGRGRQGDWGYLDVDTGVFRRLQPVANFDRMLNALNPHLG